MLYSVDSTASRQSASLQLQDIEDTSSNNIYTDDDIEDTSSNNIYVDDVIYTLQFELEILVMRLDIYF